MSSNSLGSVGNTFRVGFGLTGLVTFLVGLAVLLAPVKSAVIVTAFIAIYAIITGVVYVGIGIFAGERGGWARLGTFLAGLLFIVAGVVSFGNLRASAAGLAIVVTIFLGVAWIAEGIVAIAAIGSATSKIWTVLYAIISVVAGIILIVMPISSAFTLWWLLGLMLAVMGVVQIVRAFTFKGVGA